MSFKTTDKDLKVGDLVRVWTNRVTASGHRDTYSELAIVTHYHRPNVSVRGYWSLWNGKRGEFSRPNHQIELVR